MYHGLLSAASGNFMKIVYIPRIIETTLNYATMEQIYLKHPFLTDHEFFRWYTKKRS